MAYLSLKRNNKLTPFQEFIRENKFIIALTISNDIMKRKKKIATLENDNLQISLLEKIMDQFNITSLTVNTSTVDPHIFQINNIKFPPIKKGNQLENQDINKILFEHKIKQLDIRFFCHFFFHHADCILKYYKEEPYQSYFSMNQPKNRLINNEVLLFFKNLNIELIDNEKSIISKLELEIESNLME